VLEKPQEGTSIRNSSGALLTFSETFASLCGITDDLPGELYYH
jgi:hypothetical protein